MTEYFSAQRDYLTAFRHVNSFAFTILDAILVFLLPFCLLDVAVWAVDFLFHMDDYHDAIKVEYGLLTLVPIIISIFYALFVPIIAIILKNGGLKPLTYCPRPPT